MILYNMCSVASGVSDPLRLYELQTTRLLCSWGSPDKDTGVGCHFLLQVSTIYYCVFDRIPKKQNLYVLRSWSSPLNKVL